MGWSKTAEDNYEIFCERMVLKGEDKSFLISSDSNTPKTTTEYRKQ